MERLTKPGRQSLSELYGKVKNGAYVLGLEAALDKLSQYEDTGLEPSKITEIRIDFAKCKRMYDDVDGLLATVADERDKLKQRVAVLEKALELTAEYLFDYYGTADFDVCDSLEENTEPGECGNCPRDIATFTKCYCKYFVNRAEEV